MRIVIVGSTGMLGRAVVKEAGLAAVERHEFIPLRRADMDLSLRSRIHEAIDEISPDVVINCAGITKQLVADNALGSLRINARAPREMALACEKVRARLIHVSTDCVFSGRGVPISLGVGEAPTDRDPEARYTEVDHPDPDDLYGIGKHYGEVAWGNHVTVRCSFVGKGQYGLLHDLTARHATGDLLTPAWVNALWNGTTARQVAKILLQLCESHMFVRGLLHIGTEEPVTKARLVRLLSDRMGLGLHFEDARDPVINRVLGIELAKRVGLEVPPIDQLIRGDWL